VVEDDAGAVVAFASTSSYRDRECYAGIAEYSVYVARANRDAGAGGAAMAALVEARSRGGSLEAGVAHLPREGRHVASRAPMARMGFREVGICSRHGRLDGTWRDCVIVERLIGEAE
jgi:L-amino acid N-acyltransferase YncA